MAPNELQNNGAQGTPDTTNPSGTVVYITPDTAIPPFRGHLRTNETNTDEGISLDVFLALLERKFRNTPNISLEEKKEKLISNLDTVHGDALEVIINNSRLEEAKDWPSYERILRSLFQDTNQAELHGISSRLIYTVKNRPKVWLHLSPESQHK